MAFGKANDSEKSWPVREGRTGLKDPYWKRISDAKEMIDNGHEEVPTKRGGKRK